MPVAGAVPAAAAAVGEDHDLRGVLRRGQVAGATVYAEVSLPIMTITGLYTSIMCLLAYAMFGPSQMLVLGPDSALGSMIAATILRLAGRAATPSGRSRSPRCSRSWSQRS